MRTCVIYTVKLENGYERHRHVDHLRRRVETVKKPELMLFQVSRLKQLLYNLTHLPLMSLVGTIMFLLHCVNFNKPPISLDINCNNTLKAGSQYDARACVTSCHLRIDARRNAKQHKDRLGFYPCIPLCCVIASCHEKNHEN